MTADARLNPAQRDAVEHGDGPLLVLAGAYLVACLILWSGWRMFLPGTSTPFVPIDGFAALYFGVGRWIYFGAPVLVGWGIGGIAARQRFRAGWPTAGMALISLIGATAQMRAGRPAVLGGAGPISMGLALGPSLGAVSHGLIHALVIFSLAALPFLVWRLQKARSLSA